MTKSSSLTIEYIVSISLYKAYTHVPSAQLIDTLSYFYLTKSYAIVKETESLHTEICTVHQNFTSQSNKYPALVKDGRHNGQKCSVTDKSQQGNVVTGIDRGKGHVDQSSGDVRQ